MKHQQGFTLIEVLMVLVILSVLFAFAVPSYQEYSRKKDRAVAQQQMQRLAMELEQWRGKNFSYKNFTTTTPLTTPIYNITITDSNGVALSENNADGFAWRMYAQRNNPAKQGRHYDLLMTNLGVRCMTRSQDVVSKGDCGTNKEDW